ncbi:MAG TPA: M23 family metallopeptidase [Alloacidobacterium sp.]|nr:M23 family metallopeptidase [Alloacidobacterium sp.]
MPTVPSSFVPSVSAQPTQTPRISGPFVAPMENAQPAQMERAGQTMLQAGAVMRQTGQTIGDQIQAQMDDTAVRQAETQMLSSITDTLHGQNGYLHTRGQGAVDGYDSAAAAVAKAKNDAQQALTNPLQQRMFAAVADRHLATFGAEMNDHRFQQVASMSAKSTQDRIQSYIPLATNARQSWNQTDEDGKPAGNFQSYVATITNEAQNAAHLLYGAAPDSDIAKTMVRDALTEVARGSVVGFMNDHAYSEAKAFFDNWNGKGLIDERTAEQLGTMIKTNMDRETVETGAENAARYAMAQASGQKQQTSLPLPVMGGSITQRLSAEHNGLDIAVPVGTRVQSPANGKVLKVFQDEENGGGLSMLVQFDNGYIGGFAHLSKTNYQPGQQVTQGQTLALSGDSGWHTTGPHLHYTLTDPDGKKVDPTTVGQAPAPQTSLSLDDFTDPKALQAAIDQVRSTQQDPVLQKETVNYLESLQRKARVQKDEMQQQNFQQAQDILFKTGSYMSIPPDLWATLPARQQYLLKKGIPRENNEDVQADFILNPQNQTVDWVQAHRMDFTPETYISYLTHAKNMDADPQSVPNANFDMSRLKYFANAAGMNVFGKQQPEDKQSMSTLAFAVQNAMDAEQQAKKRKLTQSEKDEIMQRELAKQTVQTLRSKWNPLAWFGNTSVPEQVYQFNLPPGATQVVPGSDGKMHYTDGKNDLGVVK